MPKLRALILSALVLSALLARHSWATSVYDNFGPSNAYQTGAGWLVFGPSTGTAIEDAMSFTPSATTSFSSVNLAVGLISGTNSVNVALASNNSGVPGATIESFTISGAMGTFGFNNPPLVADSVTHPTLSAGLTYWLVVSAGGNTEAVWNDNSTGALGGLQQFDSAGWTSHSTTPTGAFRIVGAELSPVPEPATIALFGSGLMAASGYCFARRRRAARRPG